MARRGRKPVDIVGKRFGYLTVLADLPGDAGLRVCEVRCDCGRVCTKVKGRVTVGNVRSCGRTCRFAWHDKRVRADSRALALLTRREAGEKTAAIATSLGFSHEGVNRLLRRARRVRKAMPPGEVPAASKAET